MIGHGLCSIYIQQAAPFLSENISQTPELSGQDGEQDRQFPFFLRLESDEFCVAGRKRQSPKIEPPSGSSRFILKQNREDRQTSGSPFDYLFTLRLPFPTLFRTVRGWKDAPQGNQV
jgi:hypothetical protein